MGGVLDRKRDSRLESRFSFSAASRNNRVRLGDLYQRFTRSSTFSQITTNIFESLLIGAKEILIRPFIPTQRLYRTVITATHGTVAVGFTGHTTVESYHHENKSQAHFVTFRISKYLSDQTLTL